MKKYIDNIFHHATISIVTLIKGLFEMIKTFIFLLKLALVGGAIFWFTLNPGSLTIEWFDHVYKIHIGLGILGILVVSVFGMIVLYIFLTLKKLPQIWRDFRNKSREKKGYQSFTQGLTALAMEDFETAREKILKTQFFLNDSPLPLILTALSAQKSNDYASATRVYGALLKDKTTEFLGYYGLTQTANSQKDYPAAYLYAKKALELEPSSKWCISNIFYLSLRLNDIEQSFVFLKKIKKYKIFDHQKIKHLESVCYYLMGGKSLEKGFDTDPSFVPCALALAKEYIFLDKFNKAEKVLEKSLKEKAHPDTAYLYVHLQDKFSPAQKIKRAEYIVKITNANYVGHFILAQTAIEEGFTGIARTHLDLAILCNQGVSFKLKLLANALESLDHVPLHLSSKEIISQKQEKTWLCDSCGHVTHNWSLICVVCDQIDQINWTSPVFNSNPITHLDNSFKLVTS